MQIQLTMNLKDKNLDIHCLGIFLLLIQETPTDSILVNILEKTLRNQKILKPYKDSLHAEHLYAKLNMYALSIIHLLWKVAHCES